MIDWYVEGVEFGNCNCKYGCPCQFEDLPSHGHCQGFEVLRIDKGYFGEVDLAGLNAALVYVWPGAVFEGNGTMQAIIDERANERQRDALNTILHGGETKEAATHWWSITPCQARCIRRCSSPFSLRSMSRPGRQEW